MEILKEGGKISLKRIQVMLCTLALIVCGFLDMYGCCNVNETFLIALAGLSGFTTWQTVQNKKAEYLDNEVKLP